MEVIKEWAGLLGTVLAIGAMFYSWLTSQSKANSNRLNDVEKKINTHETILTKMENEFRHLPDKDMVTDLKIEITRLAGTVSTLGEKVGGMDRAVRKMDTYLRADKNE